MNFSHHDFRLKRSFKAFGLVHVLVLFMATSIILVTSLSIVFKKGPSVNDKYVMGCILNNASGITFNNTSGDITSYPSSGICFTAYNGCKQGNNTICDSLFYYADGHGTADQQVAALKILRATCDQGGSQACDYFIIQCIRSGSTSSPYCDNPGGFLDIAYYFKQPDNSSNGGSAYIKSEAQAFYKSGVQHIKDELLNDCAFVPNSIACNITNNEASSIPSPADPACGTVTVGPIKVSACNNTYNLVPNATNPNGAGCWLQIATACNGIGCSNRHTCNHSGAVQACAALNGGVDYGAKNWRLPTNAELESWRTVPGSTSPLTTDALSINLCDGTGTTSTCGLYAGCTGSYNNNCFPARTWSADPNGINFSNYYLFGSWYGPYSLDTAYALSVRCVRTL